MNKGKRYKKKQRRFNNFLIFYLILVLVTVVNYSFSKYSATVEGTADIKTAKFNIMVNNKKLGEEENFNLVLSSAENTFNNKIAPGSEGYFEITINPSETHVNLDYEITFDLSKINTENRTINLTKYSLDKGNTFIEMPANNKINGEIKLKNKETGFTENDIVTLRVYWQWIQDIINPTFENTTIQVTSIIKQKVTNRSENTNE